MNIQLHSHVGRVIIDHTEEEVEGIVETVELKSLILPLTMTFDIKSNTKKEFVDLDSTVSSINSLAYISNKKKSISLSSYMKEFEDSIEIKTAEQKIGSVAVATRINAIHNDISIRQYRFPMTYTAHLQHIENKTSLYHIE